MKGVIDFKALRNTSETARIFKATGKWPNDPELLLAAGNIVHLVMGVVEIDELLADLIQRIEALEALNCTGMEGGAT